MRLLDALRGKSKYRFALFHDGGNIAEPAEVKKTLKEATDADREQRQSQQNDAAADVSAAIKTLSDAQDTQTAHEDRHEKIN